MATNTQSNLPRPAELLSKLLDKGYTDETASVIRAITQATEGGALSERLKQFDARAKELADAGQTMSADDPVLRALLADFGDSLRRDALLIDAAGPGLESLGINAAGQFVRQTSLPGFSDAQLNSIGFQWNSVDPEAVRAAIQYTSSDAWKAELAKYQDGIAAQVQEIALRGIIAGRNPLDISRELQAAMQNIPAYRANSLMRTMQLESYRAASAMNQDANRDILEVQIRIAALDDRTCLCCIALHGTEMPVGQTVEDHDNGRCTSITRIKGDLGDVIFRRYVGDDIVAFKSGEDWFNSLPDARKLAIAGPGAFEALQRGDVRLADFVKPYYSPIFGDMVRQGGLEWAMNNPNRMILTVNGLVRSDAGNPGDNLESLGAFVNSSDGPLATALKDFDMALLDLDFDTDQWTVNDQNVKDAAKRFVAESQDIEYGKDYLLSLVQQQASENGVTLSLSQAEQAYNQLYKTQAQAILKAAEVGNVRLTDAQYRRLQEALRGNYLDLVYTKPGSEAGSLANAARRVGGNRLTGAELKAAREQFRQYVTGLDDTILQG